MTGQGAQAATPVELPDGHDDRLALARCLGDPHGVCEFVIWNINSRFHDSTVHEYGIHDDACRLSYRACGTFAGLAMLTAAPSCILATNARGKLLN